MSAFTNTYLAWIYATDSVFLAADDRRIPIPVPVATLLLSGDTGGLTEDPARDLLLLEQDLRWETARLASQLAVAAAEVDVARQNVDEAELEIGCAGRRVRQAAGGHLADATAEHATLGARHRGMRDAVAAVRALVRDAQVPDGWLAGAAAGWARDPEPPAWVSVFADEAAFLDGDARRSVPGWWGGSDLGGVHVGYEWRRDFDDDDPLADGLLRAGPWWVAWLPATGEIYATRRSAYLPEQVWLLGSGFTDREPALTLLRQVERHMREPNSLVLAAERVHEQAIREAVTS